MLITAVLMTGLLSAASLREPGHDQGGDQDSVVATAPATTLILDATAGPVAPAVDAADPSGQSATPHRLDTDQQIAQWLAARAPVEARPGNADFWRDDRKTHGEVSVGFGTGGYRDYGAAVSLPIGESGRLDISIRQVENGYGYGYGYGPGYGYGYEPFFYDGGRVFDGVSRQGAAAEYEGRGGWADGVRARPAPRPQEVSAE